MGKMIGAAEFKAKCLRIMEEAKRTGETVVITKRGKPFMELKPISPEKPEPVFGFMKGTVLYSGDLVNPVSDEPWNAEKGILVDDEE